MPARKWTEEYLKQLVSKSISICAVLRASGCKPSGGMHRHVTGLIRKWNIDISHFGGQDWSKGKTAETDPRIKHKKNKDVFCRNSISPQHVVRYKYKKLQQIEYRCTICKNDPIWNDEPLTLQLDHINGIHTDQRLENLRWTCPNCHSQTKTFSSKKQKANDEI